MCKKTFVDFHYFILIHKGKLHIDLRKFRLTVRTKIFIAETFCNLEIAIISGAHQ